MKKVLLVDPTMLESDEGVDVLRPIDRSMGTSALYREPIGLEYVGGALKYEFGSGLDVSLFVSGERDLLKTIRDITRQAPRYIGITVHARCFLPKVNALVTGLREKLPDSTIFAGGYGVVGNADILISNGVDYVIEGQGERPVTDLFRYLERGQGDLPHGIWSRENLHTGIRLQTAQRSWDMFKRIRPLRDRSILTRSKCGPLCYPPPDQQRATAQISYSRGCPFQCSFCQSPVVFRKKVVYRNPQDVVEEMRWLRDEFGVDFFVFTDLAINLNKERLLALTSAIKRMADETGGPFHWGAFATIDKLDDPETVDALRESGCTRLAIGIDSLNPSVLSKAKSRLGYRSAEDILPVLERVYFAGFIVRGYIIMGWPDETEEDYEYLKSTLPELPIDHIRISFATPFEGTPLWNQMIRNDTFRSGIKDYIRFTTDEPVLGSRYITHGKQIALARDVVRAFYRSPSYAARLHKKLETFPELEDSFVFFEKHLMNKGIIKYGFVNPFSRNVMKGRSTEVSNESGTSSPGRTWYAAH